MPTELVPSGLPRAVPGLCPETGSALKAHGTEAGHGDKDRSIGQSCGRNVFPGLHTRAGKSERLWQTGLFQNVVRGVSNNNIGWNRKRTL